MVPNQARYQTSPHPENIRLCLKIRQSLFWLRKKDSNPHKQSQSLPCYLYTIPQSPLIIISHNFILSRFIFHQVADLCFCLEFHSHIILSKRCIINYPVDKNALNMLFCLQIYIYRILQLNFIFSV